MSEDADRQNRFLRRARISETTFAKIIYLWIRGETYSSIPDQIVSGHENLEQVVEHLRSLNLSNVGNTKISRQALHTQINAASTKLNVMVYLQRVELLKDILFGVNSASTNPPPFALRLISEREDTTAERLLEKAQNQSVSEFVQTWGKIVYLVSANKIPYGAMRSIEGVKPFDSIMEPIIGRHDAS